MTEEKNLNYLRVIQEIFFSYSLNNMIIRKKFVQNIIMTTGLSLPKSKAKLFVTFI